MGICTQKECEGGCGMAASRGANTRLDAPRNIDKESCRDADLMTYGILNSIIGTQAVAHSKTCC